MEFTIYLSKLPRESLFSTYIAYGDFKYLTRRTASDDVLRDKAFTLLKIRTMMCIKGVLLQWSINCFDKKTSVWAIKNKIMSNKELAEELHKLNS